MLRFVLTDRKVDVWQRELRAAWTNHAFLLNSIYTNGEVVPKAFPDHYKVEEWVVEIRHFVWNVACRSLGWPFERYGPLLRPVAANVRKKCLAPHELQSLRRPRSCWHGVSKAWRTNEYPAVTTFAEQAYSIHRPFFQPLERRRWEREWTNAWKLHDRRVLDAILQATGAPPDRYSEVLTWTLDARRAQDAVESKADPLARALARGYHQSRERLGVEMVQEWTEASRVKPGSYSSLWICSNCRRVHCLSPCDADVKPSLPDPVLDLRTKRLMCERNSGKAQAVCVHTELTPFPLHGTWWYIQGRAFFACGLCTDISVLSARTKWTSYCGPVCGSHRVTEYPHKCDDEDAWLQKRYERTITCTHVLFRKANLFHIYPLLKE